MTTRTTRRFSTGEAILRGLISNLMLTGLIVFSVGLIPWWYTP